MGVSKYRFNPETLQYEKIERKFSAYLLRTLAYVGLVLFVAAGITLLFLNYYDTPEAKALKEENSLLLARYNEMNEKLQQVETVLDEIQVRDDNIYRVIFNSEPIPESVRKAGFGGTDAYASLSSLRDADIVVNTSRKLDIISKQAYIQAKSYEEVLDMALTKDRELASIPAILPLSDKDLAYTSSGWGMRVHPVYGVPRFHYGMDFVAPRGTKIYSTGAGKVVSVRSLRTGHGKHVVIDHGFGYQTLYGHMSAFNVKVGDTVSRGHVIGYVGSTGTSTAPHLHYEVHKNGKNVDPKYYYFKDLTPEEFDQLVAISSNVRQSFD